MVVIWSRKTLVSVDNCLRVWLILVVCLILKHTAAQDVFRIACGGAGNVTDDQAQTWQGDASKGKANSYLNLGQSQDIAASTSVSNVEVPNVPYLTARIFTSPASYSFPVNVGWHWIRLYFYPFAYQNYDPAHAIVSVKTDVRERSQKQGITFETRSAPLERKFAPHISEGRIIAAQRIGACTAHWSCSGVVIRSHAPYHSTAAPVQAREHAL